MSTGMRRAQENKSAKVWRSSTSGAENSREKADARVSRTARPWLRGRMDGTGSEKQREGDVVHMKSVRTRERLRSLLAILCTLILLPGCTPAYAQQQSSTPPASASTQAAKIPPEQLDSLVAPIALYPDSLLAQVL